MKKWLIWVIGLLILLINYYFELPPLNIQSPAFWHFMFNACFVFMICLILFNGNRFIEYGRFNFKLLSIYKYILIAVGSIFGLIIIINLFSSPFFNAKEYSGRIIINQDKSFTEDIKQVDYSRIPLIDKDSSEKLGDRKMGEFTSMVSQFYVSDLYTQINYNNKIVRVTPLEYADVIKYFTNHKEGIKGYIMVNSVDGTSELVTLEKGMKYMPSAILFDNLNRKLRLKYPTTIFDKASFEIDNEGNPYWIIPTVKYKAIGLKKEINGAVLLDPITGKSQKYKLNEIPSWVDHVYSADLIIDQINNWGEYKNGFLNSIFGQKDVINTTEGYNYLVMDDDVYLYTGITSVSTDESNLGFVLVNLRTKETNYYLVPGAEEFSAMASAEGLVQEKKYNASFPLLINLNGRPTYLLSLKDAAGLVKMYAFIDVEDYQKVVVSDSSLGIEVAAEKYLNDTNLVSKGDINTKTISIKSIATAVIDNNTYYFITDNEGNKYSASIKIAKNILPFIKNGDEITVTFNENTINQITQIK